MTERRAERLVRAGQLLYGDRWQSALAEATGLSQQLMAKIAAGDRAVTDETEAALLRALLIERDRRASALEELDRLIEEMRGFVPSGFLRRRRRRRPNKDTSRS